MAITFTSYTGLAADKKIYDLIQSEIEKVNKNQPNNLKIEKFLLLFKELEADDGELTRTKKVRRSVINQRYRSLVSALYKNQKRANIDTEVTYEDGRKGKISASIVIQELAETFKKVEAA